MYSSRTFITPCEPPELQPSEPRLGQGPLAFVVHAGDPPPDLECAAQDHDVEAVVSVFALKTLGVGLELVVEPPKPPKEKPEVGGFGGAAGPLDSAASLVADAPNANPEAPNLGLLEGCLDSAGLLTVELPKENPVVGGLGIPSMDLDSVG